jgi:murein DD-endopeptidase MepM/ murein hydrolase activator NlpD
MAASLFSFKKNPSIKTSPLIDPTKFGGAVFGGKKTLSRSEASEKTIANKEIKELSYIKRALETLVSLEKRHFEILTDSIKAFVLSEEKRQFKDEESLQEKQSDKTKKEEKNPLVKQGKKTLEGIGNFFQGLIKTFIAYKVLQWASNPENVQKIQDFVNLFGNIFKFLNAIVGFGIDKLFSGLSKLIGGEGVTRVFGFLEAAVGFFTLKWLLNPTKIISDIKMIGNLFTKVIPNAINGIINFFTNLIPKAAGEAADEALSQAGKQITEGATATAKGAATGAEAAGTGAKAASTAGKAAGTAAKGVGAAAAKGGAKVTGKSLLKALPVIGAVSSAFFAADRASKGDWLGAGGEVLSGVAGLLPGWGTAASLGIDAALIGRDIAKEQGVPMLAKGGIVTKPTEAIVGEAGPEAILPLDKLGSFGIDGFKASTNKMIPKFMKLLTLPFNIVGAGIVALISSTVGKIPGIGQFILPLISGIASSFGLPAGLVTGMTNFVSGVTSAVSTGLGDISTLFGKNEVNIQQQKGEEFSPSNDTSVKGLLGNILGALISKQSKPDVAPETTPATPSTPPATPAPAKAPSTPSAPAGATPAPAPAETPSSGTTAPAGPPSVKVSPIFTYPTQGQGSVPGQGGGDKIPALLEPGEYVLNRNAVQGMGGPKILDDINYNKFARFQTGGRVVTSIPFINRNISGVTSGMHMGADIQANYEALKAYVDGEVIDTSPPSPAAGYGPKWLVWKGSDGRGHMFAHMSQVFVKKGDKVRKGQKVGISGNAGTGPHLHWEVATNPSDVGQDKSSKRTRLNPVDLFGVNAPFGGDIRPGEGSTDIASKSQSGAEPGATTTSEVMNPEMGAELAKNLGKLFQMLNPSASPTELVQPPQSQTPKVTTAVSGNSQNLQRVQRENLKIQSETKQKSKGTGNVITLGEPNRTITEAKSQAMSPRLGGTTAPNSLINYPIAP